MSYADLCNEAAWQKRVDELERQLAEARNALNDCPINWGQPMLREQAEWWLTKYADVLKAARET